MSQPGHEKKSKEIKIEARKVITPEEISKNKRMMKLLHIIGAYGSLTEKALNHLIYIMKEKGLDLDYRFFKIGNSIASKELREDILSLLYVDFIETHGRAKKIRLTSAGKEVLEKNPLPEEEEERIHKLVEEARPQVSAIDAEVELYQMSSRRR